MELDDNKQALPRVGLGAHSARGLAYMISGAMLTKLLSVGGQIALSYLLSKKDFGVVGLTLTFTVVIQIIEQTGVTELLVQRRRFQQWAVAGFWLSLALGILSCCLIALSAPIGAAVYGDKQLFWALLIMAPSSIFNSLMAVPRAKLARELRFRALAVANLTNATLRTVLTVSLAALHFGPYSFVLPVPIASAATAAFLWWCADPPFSLQMQFHKWRYLAGDSWQLLSGGLALSVLDQSDYVMIGLFRTVEEVGIYWFGYCFSIQVLQLLSINVMNILFPALAKLNDRPNQQFQAFIKAQRIMAMIGMTGCFLQAALSRPLTLLVLPSKWEPSIVVMQILSIGMATRMVAGSAYALLKSQGRFRTIGRSRWGFVVLQLVTLVTVLALGGSIAAVAGVIGVMATLIGATTLYLSLTPYGAGWKAVADVLVRPFLCAAAGVGAAWIIAMRMKVHGCGDLLQFVETMVIGIALSALFAWLLMRPTCEDLWMRILQIAPKRLGKGDSPSNAIG